MKESQLQKTIKDYLILNGWMVTRINTVGIYDKRKGVYRKLQDKGMGDLVCLKDGISCWAEIKLPGEKQNPDQIAFECEVRDHKGHYFILRSIEDAEEMNKFVDRCNY